MHAQPDLGQAARFQAMKTTAPWAAASSATHAAAHSAAHSATHVGDWARELGHRLPPSAHELEAIECAAYRSLFEVGAALFGDSAFQVDASAGATAFVSPLVAKPGVFNRVLGLGLRHPPRPAELIGLTEHFRHAGCVPAFELPQPHVDRGAAEALRALRIRHAATAVVLQMRLDDAAAAPPARELPAGLRVVAAGGDSCRAAATICAEVFAMPQSVLSLLQALQEQPGWQLWLALLEGRPAGAALSFTRGTAGWFGWAATLPDSRGRGVKGALDGARLGAARAAGCTLVASDTALGTPAMPDPSLRSLLRSGFGPSHLRATYLPTAEAMA